MAGGKGKGKRSAEHRGGDERGPKIRKVTQEELGKRKGKGKRSVEQAEHRGGDERGPMIRKVTQEEMGKRKGKLQIKDRDKLMELEKVRRLEQKGKKAAVPEGAAADFATQMTEEKVAFYKKVMETDYGDVFVPEEFFPYYPGGAAVARLVNSGLRQSLEGLKERAATRLDEYAATGRLECCQLPGFRQA